MACSEKISGTQNWPFLSYQGLFPATCSFISMPNDVCENYTEIYSSVNQMRRHSNRKEQQQTQNECYVLSKKAVLALQKC